MMIRVMTHPCSSNLGTNSLVWLAKGSYASFRSELRISIFSTAHISWSHLFSRSATMTSKTRSLPSDFLSSPASKPTKTTVDLSKIMGREYANSYVAVIDNAFTLAECTQLLHAAEAHGDGVWEQAMINVGNYQQELATDIRDCGRLIWDDHALVEKIWSRVKHLVPEIHVIKDQPGVTAGGRSGRRRRWWLHV